eukprot:747503-Hanusia_phi.AAC.1
MPGAVSRSSDWYAGPSEVLISCSSGQHLHSACSDDIRPCPGYARTSEAGACIAGSQAYKPAPSAF